MLCVSLPSCCRFSPRQSGSPLQSGATYPCCLRRTVAGSASGATHFRGHICVHFRYGPMAHCHPKDDLVDRLQRFSFLPPCYPSYEASDFCPGGTHLPLNTPAFAGHTTAREVFPQAAHPVSFVERVMGPVVRRLAFTFSLLRRAMAGSSSPNTAPAHRRGTRYSTAAIPRSTFAAVSVASTECGPSSRRSREPR